MKLLEAGQRHHGVWLGKQILGQVDQVQVDARTAVESGILASRPDAYMADNGTKRQQSGIQGAHHGDSQRPQA